VPTVPADTYDSRREQWNCHKRGYVIRRFTEGATYREIGVEIGLGPERVRQVRAKGLRLANRHLRVFERHLKLRFPLPEDHD